MSRLRKPMSKPELPNNAPDWAAFLLKNQLPSPLKVGPQALRAMEQETLPYAKLAQQINADPVLSFYLMDAAARLNGDVSEYSKTLDHAMSMIGTEAVKNTIRKVPLEDTSLEETQSLLFMKSLSSSLLCAHLARRIAKDVNMANSDDIFWSGLFVYVPEWYLWRFATNEMKQIVETTNKPTTQAQIDVLNCSQLDIAHEVMLQLALPPLVKSCYLAENQITAKQWVALSRHMKSTGTLLNNIDNRELKVLLQQPVFIVQLAKLIADASLKDWYGKASHRAHKVLSAYLNISVAEALRLTHEVAADMSREHAIPGILSPAARLFLPPLERKLRATPTVAPQSDTPTIAEQAPQTKTQTEQDKAATPTEPTDLKKPSAPKPIYTETVTAMYKTPQDFNDLHELMNAATSALVYGLELGRATISLINKERTRVKTYYATGCQEHAELAQFDARLVKGTLFDKLCSKAASVWVKPSSDSKITSLVPSNFKQVNEVEDYFLMSIFVNEKPFAIVYCDAYPENGLNETHYKYFKYLCKGISNTMPHLVLKKAKTNPSD
jgi:hypothetical protein